MSWRRIPPHWPRAALAFLVRCWSAHEHAAFLFLPRSTTNNNPSRLFLSAADDAWARQVLALYEQVKDNAKTDGKHHAETIGAAQRLIFELENTVTGTNDIRSQADAWISAKGSAPKALVDVLAALTFKAHRGVCYWREERRRTKSDVSRRENDDAGMNPPMYQFTFCSLPLDRTRTPNQNQSTSRVRPARRPRPWQRRRRRILTRPVFSPAWRHWWVQFFWKTDVPKPFIVSKLLLSLSLSHSPFIHLS